MKKLTALFLALMMVLALCACGSEEAPAEAAAPAAPAQETADDSGDTVTETQDASGADVYVLTDDMLAEDEVNPNFDEAMFNAALACKGESVDALYAAVGEPDDTHYVSSCLDLTGEDGELFYDRYGFYVWTLKNADGETVQDVREN